MKSLIPSLLLAALAALLVGERTLVSQERQAADDPAVRKLLVERRDTLRELREVVQSNYRAGQLTLHDVVQAENALLEAELELAETSAERRDIYAQRLENLRGLEAAVEAQFAAGVASHAQRLAAKASRLQAEIDLHRAGAAE